MDKKKELKQDLIDIVKKFVSKPNEVDINVNEYEEAEEKKADINLKVSEQDIPICIGVKGSTAEALRKLCILIARNKEYDRNIYFRVDAPKLPKNHYYN